MLYKKSKLCAILVTLSFLLFGNAVLALVRPKFAFSILLCVVWGASIAFASEPFFAGSYDSYFDTEPKIVVLRYEIVDADSRAPIADANVRLKGIYEHLGMAKEFELRATTGPDGVVVFGLRWKAWEYSQGHDVERAQYLEVRHPKYQFHTTSRLILETLSNELSELYIFDYKHIGEFEDWLYRTGSKIFFYDGRISRSEFFMKIRDRQYGKLESILYHSINTAEDRSGPFLVLEQEIPIQKIEPSIIITNPPAN